MSGVAASSDVFRAIADPTRRGILDLLADGERAAGDLVAVFDTMTQPALSQHLRVLRDAGLVADRRHGRLRIYRLTPAPLGDVHAWTTRYERFWTGKLAALGDYLDQSHGADS